MPIKIDPRLACTRNFHLGSASGLHLWYIMCTMSQVKSLFALHWAGVAPYRNLDSCCLCSDLFSQLSLLPTEQLDLYFCASEVINLNEPRTQKYKWSCWEQFCSFLTGIMSIGDLLFVIGNCQETYLDAELLNFSFHLCLNPAKWFYNYYCFTTHDCKFFH